MFQSLNSLILKIKLIQVKKIIVTLLFGLIFITPSFAQQGHGEHLGKINFPTSGKKIAQPYFERGVMWLHSFEYNEAREDFQKAISLDPNFVMAYWGVAMTYNHTLWSEQDTVSANKILEQLGANPSDRVNKAQTPKEKGFIQAINLLYGNNDKKTRDIQYSNAMRELYQKNLDDDEIASFYALSLLGMAEGQRDFQLYMQAAGIVEEIYQRNKQHPGALHYLIHSYDDPIHAPLGLRAARSYAKTAPNASHALHMPSHIFLALGLWDDVIASNDAAWMAGLKQNTSGNLKNFTLDDLHALEWLSYGYLQKKEYKKAYQLTKKMESIAQEAQSPMTKWYYSLMRAAYISSSHDWNADLKSFNMNHVELSARASDFYINALIALNKDSDANKAKNILLELEKAISSSSSKKDTYLDYFTSITPIGIKSAKMMALEIEAQIDLFHHQNQKALLLLKKATDIENLTTFDYGPPVPVKPAYESYADLLMQEKQYEAAYREYSMILKCMPNRTESVQGLAEAAQKLKENHLPVPDGIPVYFNRLMLPS